MTWIKICGTTNLEDAKLAVDAGADALGFVFYEKSPRRVSVEETREIVAELPDRVEKVGVFVGPANDFLEAYNGARLTAIQQHLGFEEPSARTQIGFDLACFWQPPKFYMALPVDVILSNDESVRGMIASFAHWNEIVPQEGMPPGLFETFLLDSGTRKQPGGTGVAFDWQKARPLVESMRDKVRVVIAGGLNPENVGEAIRVLHPWGVDVASGTEARPGKKDPEKVRAFVEAVRRADRAA